MKLLAKIKKGLKSAWNFMDGKKLYVGTALHVALIAATKIFAETITTQDAAMGHILIGQLTGAGLLHKGVKNKEKINKVINDATSVLKKK